MKLHESMIVDQSNTLLDGLGDEAVGFYLAVEKKLYEIAAPEVNWTMESGDTGLLRAVFGKRQDFLTIRHDRFPEYSVLLSARSNGAVLHLSWLVLAKARLANDLRRAFRLRDDGVGRYDVGAELDALDVLLLNDFFAVTKLAFKTAVRMLAGDDLDESSDDRGVDDRPE
jgi:hypothetical protein